MFSDPVHNLEQLGLSDGHIVADFGAGSGFYTLAAAKMVAPTGKVYAIDVQKDLLERLRKEGAQKGSRNIDVLTGDLEKLGGSRVRDNACDVVILSNVLFMAEDRKSMLLEARRVLKPLGRLLLIDWAGAFGGVGNHVIYKDDAQKLAKETGFSFDREIDAGNQHYGIIFRKQ